MAKYLSPNLIKESFGRLKSCSENGKNHLERTSALLYFLSVDPILKAEQKNILDLNPESAEGKENRKKIALQFCKIVLLKKTKDTTHQVIKLGEITKKANDPEKRVSSNFLTVPLKKASISNQAYFYPNRPKTPFFKLGQNATGLKWGLQIHEDWQNSLISILAKTRSPTPFTDLAIFCSKDSSISNSSDDLLVFLQTSLYHRFTLSLVKFWFDRIKMEKVLWKAEACLFSSLYSNFIDLFTFNGSTQTDYSKMSKEELIKIILAFESKK